ncbi:hypothetical protein AB0395_09625, partial [Streptosporangium sp. NPDC051023]|uniref:hypothetical protein n=1 Tax=Streptosporangium sp. NPDC051023 TaxID=3155410 RepID=UPI00344FFCC1
AHPLITGDALFAFQSSWFVWFSARCPLERRRPGRNDQPDRVATVMITTGFRQRPHWSPTCTGITFGKHRVNVNMIASMIFGLVCGSCRFSSV